MGTTSLLECDIVVYSRCAQSIWVANLSNEVRTEYQLGTCRIKKKKKTSEHFSVVLNIWIFTCYKILFISNTINYSCNGRFGSCHSFELCGNHQGNGIYKICFRTSFHLHSTIMRNCILLRGKRVQREKKIPTEHNEQPMSVPRGLELGVLFEINWPTPHLFAWIVQFLL